MSCAKEFAPDEIIKSLVGDFASPKCDSCGGILKSATVSFGQAMPEKAMRVAQEWTEQAEVFIVMGSSLQVQPAASFPVMAKRNGALLAIINREAGPLDELGGLRPSRRDRRVLRQIRRDDRRWMTRMRSVGRKERKKRKVKHENSSRHESRRSESNYPNAS